ncbi:MAG: V-type ATP synthase subunit I [Phycisphaerae bacterium]
MIVQMRKAYIVARQADREALLEALRQIGVLHVEPLEPARAVAAEQQVQDLHVLDEAVRVLSSRSPAGSKPQLEPFQAAQQVQQIERQTIECESRLTSLYRQLHELEAWGDVRLEQFQQLQQAGLIIRFAAVDAGSLDRARADCVEIVDETYSAGQVLIALVAGEEETIALPEEAEILELPPRDRPSIRAEAQEIDRKLQADNARLDELAHLLGQIQAEYARRQADAEYTIASRSGKEYESLYAIQGWVPAEHVDSLSAELSAKGIQTGVQFIEADEDEQPPTLIRYPRWAQPIKALFGILGTTPGYREYDLAPFFMLAMPIFTAMLVGDAGYGLIFTLVGAIFYGKMVRAGAKPGAQLILVFGIATFIWGMLTGNVFGVGPKELAESGMTGLSDTWKSLAVLWRSDPKAGRDLVMQISFAIGCVHLVLAHLRQAVGLLPDQRGIAEIGWMGFIFGWFTLVWFMFFRDQPVIAPMLTLWIILGSYGLIVLFSSPSSNPVKRLVFGLLGNLMSIPGAFGDILSYIRLMAVGLASYYIASAFNDLAMQLTEASVLAWPATILILILAHALNIGLCLVAIFAHGVRLNMLEFSTNAGVQWAGHPYAPFSLKTAANEGES